MVKRRPQKQEAPCIATTRERLLTRHSDCRSTNWIESNSSRRFSETNKSGYPTSKHIRFSTPSSKIKSPKSLKRFYAPWRVFKAKGCPRTKPFTRLLHCRPSSCLKPAKAHYEAAVERLSAAAWRRLTQRVWVGGQAPSPAVSTRTTKKKPVKHGPFAAQTRHQQIVHGMMQRTVI